MSRIPATASSEIQQSFRELWAELDELKGGRNIDLKGRRIINAGEATDATDYVTLGQAQKLTGASSEGSDTGIFSNLLVKLKSVLRGIVYIPKLQDAGIVFCKSGGELATDETKLSWRYSNDSLRLYNAAVLRWHHRIEIRCPSDTVMELSGEDYEVTQNFNRLALGKATSSYPALKRNGVELEVVKGDDSALTTCRAARFDGGAAGSTAPAWVPNGSTWDASKIDGSGYTSVQALKFVMSVQQTYTPTNVTTDRSYDANATTLDEVADVLGTLIADLQTAGLIQ